MNRQNEVVDSFYESFYQKRKHTNVYPTEFVVRTFLASYPGLNFRRPRLGQKVLDVGCGDGRNTRFLCDTGLDVYGTEITQPIVDQTAERLSRLGCSPTLTVGRNSSLPFDSESFDYLLACHSCYYCDAGEAISDNLKEYARVLKKKGSLVVSVPNRKSYIFKGSEPLEDGSYLICNDPYGNRNGYRLHAFSDIEEIQRCFQPLFCSFSFGEAYNDFYGIKEHVFWVVCQKR
jgi:ubiquinone/menaquinone biosynthesis C-methylase UbiE